MTKSPLIDSNINPSQTKIVIPVLRHIIVIDLRPTKSYDQNSQINLKHLIVRNHDNSKNFAVYAKLYAISNQANIQEKLLRAGYLRAQFNRRKHAHKIIKTIHR